MKQEIRILEENPDVRSDKLRETRVRIYRRLLQAGVPVSDVFEPDQSIQKWMKVDHGHLAFLWLGSPQWEGRINDTRPGRELHIIWRSGTLGPFKPPPVADDEPKA